MTTEKIAMGLADKLPKTVSASNREKAKSVKRRIQDDVRTPAKVSKLSTICGLKTIERKRRSRSFRFVATGVSMYALDTNTNSTNCQAGEKVTDTHSRKIDLCVTKLFHAEIFLRS